MRLSSSSLHPVLRVAGAVSTATLLLVAVAACAAQAVPAGGPTSGGAASGVVSSGPMPSGPASSAGPNLVTPEKAVDLKAQRWTSVKAVPGKSAVLVEGVLSGSPPCVVLGKVTVTETQDQVTVTVMAGKRPGASCDGPQPAVAYAYVTQVAMDAPLGDRKVVDGAR
ncbi:MAG: hypothetical protein JWP61_784 [Friedmanniella sp.]|nr:hypothetical protein [Friedmanniella sp.]